MAVLTDRTRIAAACLQKGGLIAYPTESVFGLGCIPGNQKAVTRLRQIKQRPDDQGLILITDRLDRVQPFLKPLSARQKSLIHARRHKPVTWLVPASADCPAWLRGKHDRLAIRLTRHEGARQLCRQAESALVSTSANRRGQVPAKTATEALHTLGSEIDCILSGRTGLARTVSEIRDLKTGKVYR
jgi:L-threonylcarbamoyladenylate synthase